MPTGMPTTMLSRNVRRVIASAALVIAAAGGLAVVAAPASPAAATSYPLVPSRNIPPPDYVFGGACASAPAGAACSTLFVRALSAARRAMGLPAYSLPGLPSPAISHRSVLAPSMP